MWMRSSPGPASLVPRPGTAPYSWAQSIRGLLFLAGEGAACTHILFACVFLSAPLTPPLPCPRPRPIGKTQKAGEEKSLILFPKLRFRSFPEQKQLEPQCLWDWSRLCLRAGITGQVGVLLPNSRAGICMLQNIYFYVHC